MERNENIEIISSVPIETEEDTVVKQNLWCRIRALFEQGLSKSAIARELEIDLKTVRKWLRQTWEPQQRERKWALDAYESFLRARAAEVGYNAAVLYRELEPHGYKGSYPAAEAVALIPVDLRPAPERERLEHRIVPRDTYVVVETNRYPAPVEWVGQQVEVRLLADQIMITNGSGEPLNYSRLKGKFLTASWSGAPRSWLGQKSGLTMGPPRLDPAYPMATGEIETRPLAAYEALLEEALL